MGLPAKVRITAAIIMGIAFGTGALMYGILMSLNFRDDQAAFIAGGGALLVGSIASLFAHLAGGFRDLDDRE